MARDFDGSLDYFTVTDTTTPLTLPHTISVWFQQEVEDSADKTLFTQRKNVNAQFSCFIEDSGGEPTGRANAFIKWGGGGSNETVTTSNSVASAPTGWHHYLVTRATGTHRVILDGDTANEGLSAAGITDPTWDVTSEKWIANNNNTLKHNGYIADVCAWNVELNSFERAALADGVHPLHVRPDAIVNYWSLDGFDLGGNEPDLGPNNEPMVPTSAPPAVLASPPVMPWVREHPFLDIVDTGQNVSVGTIAAGTTVLVPSRIDQTAIIPTISAGTTAVAPANVNQTATVVAIAAGTTMLAPTPVRSIAVASMAAGTSVLAPSQINQTAVVSAITAATTILAPSLGQAVAVGAITAGTSILAPSRVDQTASVAAIAAATTILAATITEGGLSIPVAMASYRRRHLRL